MNSFKFSVAALTLSLGLLSSFSLASAEDSLTGSSTVSGTSLITPKEVSLLYSLSGKSARLLPQATGDQMTLSVGGVDQRTVWFSDRPARDAGGLPTSRLVAAWKANGFITDPPNAALVLHSPVIVNGKRVDTLVVEMGKPKISGTRLTVPVRVLDQESARNVTGQLNAHGNRHDHSTFADGNTVPLGAISIFIDDAAGRVVNGCLIQQHASCPGADLSGVDLSQTDLTGANFRDANFNQANLRGTNFTRADLTRASLIGADTTNMWLDKTTITGWILEAPSNDAF